MGSAGLESNTTSSPTHAMESSGIDETDNTLTFKNELYTGEMCILFEASVGTAIHRSLERNVRFG